MNDTIAHYEKMSACADQWLHCFASATPGILQAQLVLVQPHNSTHQLASRWPKKAELDRGVSQLIHQCIAKKKPVIIDKVGQKSQGVNDGNQARVLTFESAESYLLSFPVLVDNTLYGALGVHIRSKTQQSPKQLLAPLQQAIKWLLLYSSNSKQDQGVKGRASIILKSIQTSLLPGDLNEAATALSIVLATDLSCATVAIGLTQRNSNNTNNPIRLVALSSSPNFSAKQPVVKQLALLMEESIDQDRSIVEPPISSAKLHSQLIHKQYHQHNNHCRLCTVPLVFNEDIVGAMVLTRQGDGAEQSPVFSPQDLLLIEQIAALISPIVVYRARSQQSLRQQSMNCLRKAYTKTFGAGHLTWKLALTLCVLLVVFFSLATSEYHITASATLESKIERQISAPDDGFIQSVKVQPGDNVALGQLLATLDDRELLLEKQKWSSKLQQTEKEYREALAGQETWRIGLLRAQRKQVQAQLALTESKLSRLNITAAIAGIVASGDLSQSLGAPVKQGEQLFTIAPMDDYRILLKVDESDIAYLQTGQVGVLKLRAAVGQALAFSVLNITPIAISEQTKNYFRVDAKLQHQVDYLRPGMQGVGKVSVGEYRLIWAWTRGLIDWLTITLWTWW